MTGTAEVNSRVVVIGAGLAGLCCARILQRAGLTVDVYDAAAAVGGRVRTDIVDGFRLDRGFQVLFTAYPAVKKELDLAALDLKPFDPGAQLFLNGELHAFYDPFRQPLKAIPGITSSLFRFQDKVKLYQFRKMVVGMDLTDIFLLPDENIRDYLHAYGISSKFMDVFVRPFAGGVFLQRGLSTSVRNFAMVFKMVSEGVAAVPAAGMAAIPRQIAADLTPDSIHLKSKVRALLKVEERVTGIVLEDGTEVLADNVVVATAADVAAELTGLKLPEEHRSVTCLYFEVPTKFTSSRSLILFPEPNKYAGAVSLVNSAALISNVAPGYAPEGKHLLSVSVIGTPNLTDERMAEIIRREIGGHYKSSDPDSWRLLRVYRIPWAQYAQSPGISKRLPSADTGIPGLILSGEILCNSSIQGALESGERSAEEVLVRVGLKTRKERKSKSATRS